MTGLPSWVPNFSQFSSLFAAVHNMQEETALSLREDI